MNAFIPRISAEYIESKAERMLGRTNPQVFWSPRPTSLGRIVSACEESGSLIYEHADDLKRRGLLAECVISERPVRIRVNETLRHRPDFPFTLAHELGHFALHRNLDVPPDYMQLRTPVRDLVSGRKLIETTREQLEWQANRFAAALLMPRHGLQAVLMAATIHVFRGLGQFQIHLNDDSVSVREHNSVVGFVARYYRVSRQVARNRLFDEGMIVDHRDANTAHISRVLGHEIRPYRQSSPYLGSTNPGGRGDRTTLHRQVAAGRSA